MSRQKSTTVPAWGGEAVVGNATNSQLTVTVTKVAGKSLFLGAVETSYNDRTVGGRVVMTKQPSAEVVGLGYSHGQRQFDFVPALEIDPSQDFQVVLQDGGVGVEGTVTVTFWREP